MANRRRGGEEMFGNQPLQKIPLEKNYFWHGVLSLNENGGHTFFDVKYRKNPRQGKQSDGSIGLFTNDIPPFPLGTTDTLSIAFILENNMGLTCARETICEGKIIGSDLQNALAAQQSPVDAIMVETENGAWQFALMDKTWVLRGVLINITNITPDSMAAKLILNQV